MTPKDPADMARGDVSVNSFWQQIADDLSEVEKKELLEVFEHYDSQLEAYGHLIAGEVIKRVFTILLQQDNPKIAMQAFLRAWGFTSIVDNSLEEAAGELNVTKQAISKQVTFFRDMHKLRSFGPNKSDETRETFRKIQTDHQPKKDPTNGIGFDDLYQSKP